MTAHASRSKRLLGKLHTSLQALRTGAAEARERAVVWGVTPGGHFVTGMSLAVFLAQARRVLCDSGRVYRYGDTVVYEAVQGDDPHLCALAAQGRADPKAPAFLSNLVAVGVRGEDGATQSLLPANLAGALLADDDLPGALPAIRHYARRPVFDDDFNLRGPGWHDGSGTLVHGPDITPAEFPAAAPGAQRGALDRLPPHLKGLLGEFFWRGDADLVNAVALLLTGLLVNHFIDAPHPVAILDGNQKGLGKTLLAQAVGRVLDGVEPPRLRLTSDDELEKKLCTHLLHSPHCSIFFIDNVRVRIESALLEQNVLSPVLSFRILGQNVAVTRPNSFLWVVTSNQTAGTEDFVSRGLPIRLYYEGDPRDREFDGNPVAYAGAHRLEILGELAGMVLRWRQAGMPSGGQRHRCDQWAKVIGGILQVGGLTEFLGNVREAEEMMDEGLQALAGLADYVVEHDQSDLYVAAGADPKGKGATAREWVMMFVKAQVEAEQMQNRPEKGRATRVGQFLAAKVGRTTSFSTKGDVFRATLRVKPGRANQKLYYFELENVGENDSPVAAEVPAIPADRSLAPPAGSQPQRQLSAAQADEPAGVKAPAHEAAEVLAISSGKEAADEQGNKLEWL